MWCSWLSSQSPTSSGDRRVTSSLRLAWATNVRLCLKTKNQTKTPPDKNLFQKITMRNKGQPEWRAVSGSFRIRFVLFTHWGELSLHSGTQAWMGEAQVMGCFSASQSRSVRRSLYLEQFSWWISKKNIFCFLPCKYLFWEVEGSENLLVSRQTEARRN